MTFSPILKRVDGRNLLLYGTKNNKFKPFLTVFSNQISLNVKKLKQSLFLTNYKSYLTSETCFDRKNDDEP